MDFTFWNFKEIQNIESWITKPKISIIYRLFNFSYDEISHTKYSVKPSFLKLAIFRKAENVKLLKLWKALVLYFPKIHKFVRRVIHIYLNSNSLLKISIFTFLLIWIQNFSYKSPRDIYSVRIFITGLIVSEWVLD